MHSRATAGLLLITFASASETFPVFERATILRSWFGDHETKDRGSDIMNDIQAKFAITVVAFGLVFSYAFPAMKQAEENHDAVSHQVGQVYIAPNPGDPS